MSVPLPRIEPAAQASDGLRIAPVRAPQIQGRFREVLGGVSRVVYTPALGLVIVHGPRPHAAGQVGEGGVRLESVHTSTVNDNPSVEER